MLHIIIAIIVLVVLVFLLKLLWGFFELPPEGLRPVLIIIGAVIIIYVLIHAWPYLESGW
jgi:hypothetical protein